MRLVSAIVLALALCGAAVAQRPTTPPVAKPGAAAPKPGQTPQVPVTKLPEVPAGQWDEGILKDAKVQSFEGQDYAAIEFVRLQEHVDSICHYDKAAHILGKPVATIVGYRQNMGWPALVDGRNVDIFKTADENNHADKLILPFMLVDVTDFLDDVRNDLYFRTCGGLNFKVCTVAVYGRFRYVEAKTIPDWGADLTVGDKKCIFQLEHYRKMGIVDYGGAIGQASMDAFYQGMAVSNATGGH